MSKQTLTRPAGHHVLTPSARVADPATAIAFLQSAFGAEVIDRYDGPQGEIYHAEIRVGDSVIMVGAPPPGRSAMPAALSYYVDDADAVDARYRKALDAGARSLSEPTVQPWGYRSACVADPAGNEWTICTVVEQVSHDEIVKRMSAS